MKAKVPLRFKSNIQNFILFWSVIFILTLLLKLKLLGAKGEVLKEIQHSTPIFAAYQE